MILWNTISGLKKLAVILCWICAQAGALGQGKVMFDSDALIALGANPGDALPADAALAGQPVPTSGPLPSGISLVVGLYGGTSSNNLTLQSTTPLNPTGGTGLPDGWFPSTRVILSFPGGTYCSFQIKVWDARYPSYEAQVAAGVSDYLGTNNIFQMYPGTSVAYPSLYHGSATTWSLVGNDATLYLHATHISGGPILVPQGFAAGQFRMQLVSATIGQTYSLEVRSGATSNNWITLFSTNAPAVSFPLADPYATDAMRYYRARTGP